MATPKTGSKAAGERGQILPGAVAILIILAVLIPAIVSWVQREAYFSTKQAANTTAFHLAEAGIEKAYLYISQSTSTWVAIQAGTGQTNYLMDKSYTDFDGGTYSIGISSGPGVQQVTIYSVGRDRLKRETRALKVVYSNTIFGDTAIFAGQGVKVSGGVTVEWGAVMSPYTLDVNSMNHPQFWSASQITTKDTDATPPNCDSPNCCQWHSYQASLPTPPAIDFDFYRTSAAATTGCPVNAGHAVGTPSGSCYYAGSVDDWNDATAGKTIFIEGDLTVKSPGMFHTGTIIVMGNVNLPSGAWGRGNVTMSVPSSAWKQYCNDWAAYQAYDAGAPAAFPGLTATYAPTGLTKASGKIAVNGFMYVGGNFNNGGGGGGLSDLYGVLYSIGTTTMTAASNVTFYYGANAASGIVTTNISLTRSSWQDAVRGWPAALP